MVRIGLGAMAGVLAAGVALAHVGAGPHGGLSADAGPFFFELVVTGNQLKAFVYDEITEKPQSVKGAKASGILLLGTERETVQLAPDPTDDNAVLGTAKLQPGPGMRAVIQLQRPGEPPVLVRFQL